MIKAIKEYFVKRQTKKRAEEYNKGYDWAAGVLLRGAWTPAEVETYYSSSFDSYTSFDVGAQDATDRLCTLGVVKDNR